MIKINKKTLNIFLLLITFFAFNVSVSAKNDICTIVRSEISDSENNAVNKRTKETYKTFKYQFKCGTETYEAVCLDPGKTSVKTKNGHIINFKKVQNTQLSKYMAALGQLYSSNTGCQAGTPSCLVKYQTAVRIAESKYSIGHSLGLSNSASEKKEKSELYRAYMGFTKGEVDDCSGSVCASKLAEDAYKAMGTITTSTSKGTFSKSGNDIVLTITGKNKAPKKIVYTINGQQYTDDPSNGTYNNGVFTIKVPNNLFAMLDSCEEVESDVIYDGGSDVESVDLSHYPIFEPVEDEEPQQNFAAIRFTSIKQTGTGEDTVKTITHIGPNTETKTENRTPIICEGEGEYEDCVGDDCTPEPIPCKTKFNIACAPTEDDSKRYTYNEGTIDGSGTTDWEACIINNKDRKDGNPYNIYDSNNTLDSKPYLYVDGTFKTISDANYCTVSCKEKYEFIMPSNKKEVMFGTYFSFDIAKDKPYHAVVGIQNEKQCVTSGAENPEEGIDIDKYEQRIINLRKQQIDFANVYLYYSAMLDALGNVDENEILSGNANNFINSSKVTDNTLFPSEASSRTYEFSDSTGYKDDSDWDDKQVTDWLSSKGWDTSLIYNGAQDIRKYADFNYSFQYKQFKLSNPNSVYSDLNVVTVTGKTNNSFPTTYTQFLSGIGNSNVYCDKFGLCNLDTTRAYISEEDMKSYISEYSDQLSYTYQQSDIGGTYNSTGTVSVSAKFQTKEQRLKAYKAMIEKISKIVEVAQGRISSLGGAISAQNNGFNKCMDAMSGIKDYSLDPKITWDYDQTDYMNLMDSKDLKLIDSGSSVNKLITDEDERNSINMCSRTHTVSAASSVFTSCDDKDIINEVTFRYINGSATSTSESRYYPVSRVGVTIKNKCQTDGGFCYYGSSTPFATYPPDGKVARVSDNVANATTIEKDGLVFPVTILTESGQHYYSLKFNNIGENVKTGEITGRIMGDDSSVSLYSGNYKNKAVCTYDVIRPEIRKCDQIVEDYCLRKDGKIVNGGYVDDLNDCINRLVAPDESGNPICCDIAKTIVDKGLDVSLGDAPKIYEKACSRPEACVGFNITDTTGSMRSSGLNAYDQALIDSNGDLQFSVRTISLNNLFPNGKDKKGINWRSDYLASTKNGVYGSRGLQISEVIDYIEEAGESIYGQEPDYKIILTPKCATALRQENSKGDLDNGFLSYNLSVETTDQYYNDYLPGSIARNEAFFSKIESAEYGCVVERKPNKKTDSKTDLEIGIKKAN